MKTYRLLLVLWMINASLPVGAAMEPRLELKTESLKHVSGDEFIVDLLVKDIATVYGTELELVFDANLLEALDMDPESEGVQIERGAFFDLGQNHFPLQNRVDNESGRIKYAVSLLNPATAAEGAGVIARVGFRGKAPGQGAIQIAKGKFGTRDGKVIIPTAENGNLVVIREAKSPLTLPAMNSTAISIIVPMLFVIVLLAAFVIRRRIGRRRG